MGDKNVNKFRGENTLYVLDIFCILSPVWTLESCDLETGMNLEGWRKQLRAVRRSDDIKEDLASELGIVVLLWFCCKWR